MKIYPIDTDHRLYDDIQELNSIAAMFYRNAREHAEINKDIPTIAAQQYSIAEIYETRAYYLGVK